ncbi:Cyclin-T1-5-like protein [Drosera capensis]
MAERVVVTTLGFNLNVQQPYKPLVKTIKRLGTSLCLQFQPHHIAAGVTFLAAKFSKVRLLLDGEKVWWQEFGVSPRQLEEVSNQMLELYEQNREPPAQGSEVESVAGGAVNHGEPKNTHGDRLAGNNQFEGEGGTRLESSQITSTNLTPDHGDLGSSRSEENQGIDYENEAMNDSELRDNGEARTIEPPSHQSNLGDDPNVRSSKLHGGKDYKEGYVSEKIDDGGVSADTLQFCQLILHLRSRRSMKTS